jgi:hypothetical protein
MSGAVPGLAAQEAEVTAAVRATLDAWRAGRHEEFVGYYHADARGFFLDGGPLMGGFTLPALQAASEAGFKADVELRDLEVRAWGGAATAVGYLVGTLTLPGGGTLPGTWRYSETRVRDGGTWKVVQFHVSPQTEAGRPPG